MGLMIETSLDRNVDLDKRSVPSKPPSLGQRSSAGKEFHRIGAEYLISASEYL